MEEIEKSRDGEEVIESRKNGIIRTISRNYKWDLNHPAINVKEYTEGFPEGRLVNLFTIAQHQYYFYNNILNQAEIPEAAGII
ncbi:MAG: hypothetical protein WC584_04320 [Candidatus Pacearchaeota archaeon]